MKETNDQHNTYEIFDEYCIGHTNNDDTFLIDLDDLELVQKYTWVKDKKYFYAKVPGTNKKITLHRLIMGFPKNMEVDHIHGQGSEFDNRKSNLRIATHVENNQNKTKYKNNTSGHKGVTWDKSKSKWKAQIGINNTTINLGRFDNIQDAINARDKVEKELFKGFANIQV